MKILAPVNNSQEVKKIIEAGADELYCGVMPEQWQSKYANIASPNRREWKTANLQSYKELKKVVNIAHGYKIPIYLALNALYTQKQYPLIWEQIAWAKKLEVDALIIADLGILLELKNRNLGIDVHISTGATVFNSQSVKFYQELKASRIILPRHLLVAEIEQIVKDCPTINFEVFVLNSGCKNIDGFCTFQHGVNEILYRQLWDWPKRSNFDRHFLNLIRWLPNGLSQKFKGSLFGIDSACLLNYQIFSYPNSEDNTESNLISKKLAKNFGFSVGIDACGVCDLYQINKIGVHSVKIVGRNYSTTKKVNDVKFLNNARSYLHKVPEMKLDEFKEFIRSEYRRIYNMPCRNFCYR